MSLERVGAAGQDPDHLLIGPLGACAEDVDRLAQHRIGLAEAAGEAQGLAEVAKDEGKERLSLGDVEVVGPVLDGTDREGLGEERVGLVDQNGGVQCFASSAVQQAVARDLAQFVVEACVEGIERVPVAGVRGYQQLGRVGGFRHRGPWLGPRLGPGKGARIGAQGEVCQGECACGPLLARPTRGHRGMMRRLRVQVGWARSILHG